MNKKGFTLTEILGVIVIISLLLILVIPGIINRISSSGDEAVEAENQIIYDAADQYIREHPEDYPPGKSGRYCITIQSLIDDGKLAAPVKDVTTGEDISDKSVMVTIYSSGNTEHELKEGAECEEIAALPMIDFIVDPSGSSWVKQRKVTIIYPEIDGNFQASHRIDNGSWIRDSSADDGGNVELVFTKIGQLEARLKGNNIISSKIDIINIDSEIPVITKVEMGSWSNGNNRVRITARDEISGINGLYISTSNTRPSEDDSNWISVSSNGGETKTFVRGLDLGTYYIWVKDKAGNISANGTSLKVVDNTKPTCTITDSGQKGSNQWYTGNVTLKMTTADKESGVASYGMNTANSAVYNGTTQMTLTYDTKSQTYYGFVKDRAGNVGTCTKNVKRDTVAPSCTLKSSGTPGNSGWYKGNITISFNSKTDATSGVASYGITTSTNASYGNNSSATQTADTKGITYYGYVKDAAGHTNKCSISVKKDSTAPTCTVTKSGTVGNNSWYKSNVTVKLSSRNDSTSGVASYGLSTSTSATYNNSTSATYSSNTSGITYYGYVRDAAGNTGKCSTWFKMDKTAPSCSISASGTPGNNSWYRSNVTLSLSRSDNLSGVASYGLTTSSSASYNGSASATRTSDTSGITYYGYVKDAAGNTNKCSKWFKMDKTAPTVSCKLTLSNGGAYSSGTWSRTTLNRKITAYDATSGVNQIQNNANGGSWATEYNAASWTLYEGKHQYEFRSIDNAGNVSNKCSINGLVDYTPPTTPYCYNFAKTSSAYGNQTYSSDCNKAKAVCNMNIDYTNGHYNYDYEIVKSDATSGYSYALYYWWPDQYRAGASYCNWTTADNCAFYFPNALVNIVQKHKTVDYAGNVSAESRCDVHVY